MRIFVDLLLLASAGLIFSIGLFAAFNGKNKSSKTAFAVFVLLLTGWNFTVYKLSGSLAVPDFKMWLQIFAVLGVSAPFVYFHFLSVFLDSDFLKKLSAAGYGAVLLILGYNAIAGFSDQSGVIFASFSIFASFAILICSLAISRSIFRENILIDRKSRTILMASLCNFIGTSLAWFYFISPLPVLGWLFLLISISLFASYVARFPAFEFRAVFSQSLKWIILTGFAVSPIIVLVYYNDSWIAVQKNVALALASLIVLYSILAYLLLIQPMIDRLFGRRFLKKQEALRSFFYSISSLGSLDELLSRTNDFFKKTFHFQRMRFFVFDDRKHKFSLIFADLPGSRIKKEIFTVQDNDFWEYWASDNRILTPRDASTFENARAAHTFARLIKSQEADVLFPLVFAGNFIGFFALASDSLKEGLRLDNLKMFDEMRDELSIVFSNSILFSKTGAWNATLEAKIQERTKELQKIHDKLNNERNTAKMFSRIIVKRELEMIELKKKAKEMPV